MTRYQIATPYGPVTVHGAHRWPLAVELADALGGTLAEYAEPRVA